MLELLLLANVGYFPSACYQKQIVLAGDHCKLNQPLMMIFRNTRVNRPNQDCKSPKLQNWAEKPEIGQQKLRKAEQKPGIKIP